MYNHYFCHPMKKNMGCNNMGFSIDIGWEDFRKEYIDEPLNDLATTVGLSDKEIEALKSDANKAIEVEKQKAAQNLLEDVAGAKKQLEQAKSPSTSITDQISDIQQSAVVQAIPGGLYTIGGVIGALALYIIVRK